MVVTCTDVIMSVIFQVKWFFNRKFVEIIGMIPALTQSVWCFSGCFVTVTVTVSEMFETLLDNNLALSSFTHSYQFWWPCPIFKITGEYEKNSENYSFLLWGLNVSQLRIWSSSHQQTKDVGLSNLIAVTYCNYTCMITEGWSWHYMHHSFVQSLHLLLFLCTVHTGIESVILI